jgi:hypothetical protein
MPTLIVPIAHYVHPYKRNTLANSNAKKKRTQAISKIIKHGYLSKESIEQDIKDHAQGGARWCCLAPDRIFDKHCATHQWHSN